MVDRATELLLAENHGETFEPRREPIYGKIVSEKFANSREPVIEHQTDHAMLQPMPAPGTRIGQITYAFTERPFESYDPDLTGAKVDIEAGYRVDPLQDQTPWNSYHVNTLRIEPEPWDDELIG